MSHVPLLAKQSVPKLQSPRRGPLVMCLCLLAGLVFLIVPWNPYAAVFGNETHAAHATHALPAKPPPEAIRRLIEYTKRYPYITFEQNDDLQQDLIFAVAHLAQREFAPR